MRPQIRSRRAWITLLLVLLLVPEIASSQSGSAATSAAPTAQAQTAPEMSSRDETPTFKVRVNLVEVRVVVRDAKGNAVGNLKQQDFQLLDNGKPQVISRFSVGTASAAPRVQHDASVNVPADEAAPGAAPPAVIPQRFIAFIFDDLHLQFGDLAQARNALAPQLQAMRSSDRAAIFTTSGQTRLDFTDNVALLSATLNRIVPRSISSVGTTPCPNISYYLADSIVTRNDSMAIHIALQDAQNCGAANASTLGGQAVVQAFARQALEVGDQQTRISLGVLQDVIGHTAAMPGQRILVLVSPGFFNPNDLQTQAEICDRAVHAGVVINTLDAQGLYVNMPDASEVRSSSPTIAGPALQYETQEQQANRDVLADLAESTGGIFFHDNNDLAEGFRRLAGQPEYSYLLAFSPENLKLDGRYHKLKVTLRAPAQGSLQARKGYFAPKAATDPAEQAKQAIQDAVFSQEEVRDIPVVLQTQFFKPDEAQARLSVLVNMDARRFQFHKADGRNNDEVIVVSALFDRNGNFVSGFQKVLTLHLKDETLASRLNSGITLKTNFELKPGSYIVRVVVRDENGQLATRSSAVEIP